MSTINDDVDNILVYRGFNSSSKRKYIDDYGFESFEYIMLLTEKYIGNLSKGFTDRTTYN